MQHTFPRSLDQLRHIVAMTDRFFLEQNMLSDKRHLVDLCIEELFVNMVTYNTETDAEILLELTAHEPGVQVTLTDFGVQRFDPHDGPTVDINAPAEERSERGLGLYLVLKMVDSISYEYRDNNSKITFVVGG